MNSDWISDRPIVESILARQPGWQAPSNLVGSKTKNTHIFFGQVNFPQAT